MNFDLQAVLAALQAEQQEEQEYFSQYVQNLPLQTRKSLGLLWYPIIIADESYDLGAGLAINIEKTQADTLNHQFQVGQIAAIHSFAEGQKKK